MCLVALAVNAHPDFPLVLLGNRDEFHARPALPMHWWREPGILAGRDLTAGGTWLGVTAKGRFATITNYRDPDQEKSPRSRGELAVRALTTPRDAFLEHLERNADQYGGYNLLWGGNNACWYHSNRAGAPVRRLSPGVYGLSNGLLDTPWPKVEAARAALAETLDTGTLCDTGCFGVLSDRRQPPDSRLPATGVSLDWERLLAPAFIVSDAYGTRASTVLVMRRNGLINVEERCFDAAGQRTGRSRFRFVRRTH